MRTRTQKSCRLNRDRVRARRALLGLEPLESRQLMASDLVSLAPDSLFAIQDQTSQILDVLGNDSFDSAYPGARQITAVSAGDRGGEFSISPDGRSVRYTPPPGFFSRENQSPATVGPALLDSIFSDSENFTYVVDGAFEQSARVYVRPVVSRDSYEVDVNDANHVLNVLSNDTFFPGYTGPKTITAVSAVTQEGTVSISADGKSLIYSPHIDFVGVEEFSYVVDDKYEAHVFVTVRTPVRGDNYGDYYGSFVRNDGSHVLNVLANDCYQSHQSNWDSSCSQIDVQQITSVEQPTSGGTVTIAADGRSLSYRSADNFSGNEVFSYVADGKFRASVTIHVGTPDDSVQFFQNESERTINVLANDLFRDGYTGARVITSVSAANGEVKIAADAKSLSYKPKPDWTGDDAFSYTVDGTLTANVTVNVRQTVQNDWVSVIENSAEKILDVMANDQFPADYVGERGITHVTDSQQGAIVKIATDGKSLLYQPQKGFFGFDQLTYTVDGTQVANVSVYVWRPFQDAWSSVSQFTGDNVLDPLQLDNGYRLTQLAEYHGAIKITALGTPDHGGTAAISADGRRVLYTPAPEFHGQETFTYTVDGEFTATIGVGVNPSVFSDDSFNVEQNSSSNSLAVLNNDIFPANYRGAKHITAVGDAKSGGAVSIDSTSALVRYTPAKDFYGRDSFTYTVDGVQTATVNVTVLRRLRDDQFHVATSSQENVLPVLVNDDFGSTYTGAKRLTAVKASDGGGTVTIAADGHSVLYTPKAGFQGNDSFTYEVDGKFVATATVTISDSRSLPDPRFSTASDLEAYLKNAGLAKYADQFGKESWSRWGGYPILSYASSDLNRSVAASGDTVASSHSDTNVQVAGVDEGDLVETDGNFLYTLTGQELVIVDALPAKDAHVVSRYAFSGTPTAMFMKGNLLTVISHTSGGTWSGGLLRPLLIISPPSPIWPGTSSTDRGVTVTVLDITDRAAPRMLQETKLDGDYFDARAIDNFVYIVARSEFNPPAPQTVCHDYTEEDKAAYIKTNYPNGYSLATPYIPAQKCAYESAESYAARADTFVNDVLPHYTTYDQDGQVVRSGILVDATDIYGDGGKYSSQLYAMLTIDITSPDPGPIATTGVLTGSDGYVPQQPVLFASANSLYLFDAKSTDNPEDPVVTQAWQIQFDKTTGVMRPIATGQLPGTVLNQFSIDETDGYLRVATTNRSPTASRTENNVFVLREDGGVLEFVGAIQDLAPTETIYSVRFFGDRGIVVTFRQIDPLFTIDLSDPGMPKVAGALKLPGFSTYIQPIDRDHVLTFGKGGPNGWDGPPQISLFDIHDLQHPTLIDQANVGTRTWSEDAWNDHHAVAYFPEYNVLAIPSNRTEYNYGNRLSFPWAADYQSTEYHETFVFRIDTASATRSDSGIQTLGRIAQDSAVRRSVRIEDSLYAIADGKITIVNVLDPTDRRATVDLRATPVTDPTEIKVIAGINTPFDDDGLGKAIAAAQKSLAHKLNVSEQAAVLVTAERNSSQDNFQVVLRAGDKQYLFHASAAGEATEVQADFAFAASAAREWHNSAQPLDTNGDASIAPIDALLVINQINLYGSRILLNSPVRAITSQTIDPAGLRSFQVDTDGDGHLSPIDALLVINYLNDRATSQRGFSGEAQGESSIAPAAAFVQIGFDTLAGTTSDLSGLGALSPSNSTAILENPTLEKPLTASFSAASILTTNSIAMSKRLTTIVPDNHPRLAGSHNDVALVELMDELTGGIGD